MRNIYFQMLERKSEVPTLRLQEQPLGLTIFSALAQKES